MAKLTDFVTADRYDTEIREKAEELRRLCIQEGIPCFFAFGLINKKEEETEDAPEEQVQKMRLLRENEYDIEAMYVTEDGAGTIQTKREELMADCPYDLKCVQAIPEVLPDFLYDRRFSDFINIVNGFRAIPKSERLSSDVEEEIISLPDTNFQKSLLDIADELLNDEKK